MRQQETKESSSTRNPAATSSVKQGGKSRNSERIATLIKNAYVLAFVSRSPSRQVSHSIFNATMLQNSRGSKGAHPPSNEGHGSATNAGD
eukprot:7885928-Heterocapsa_arctica.AAC.1